MLLANLNEEDSIGGGDASNALIAQAAHRRLIERNTAIAQSALVTQIASGDAASTPALQFTQTSAIASVSTTQSTTLGTSQAPSTAKRRGRPPGSKDKQPRKKRARVMQIIGTEDV